MLLKNSLRNQIALMCVCLISLCCAVLLLSYAYFSRQNHLQQVQTNIIHSTNVFRQYLQAKETMLITAAEVLTADFGFKQAVATSDADTISSALSNHAARIHADLMWLTDAHGVLIAADQISSQKHLQPAQPFLQALLRTPGKGFFIELNGTLYQVIVLPIKAPHVIGFALVGFEIAGVITRELSELTGVDISFYNAQNQLLSSSVSPTDSSLARADLEARQMPGLFGARPAFNHHSMELPALAGAPIGVLLSISLADFYADLDNQLKTMALMALGILLLGLGASVWLARNLTVPLAQLVATARHFAQGQYTDLTLHQHANDEIKLLFSAFSDMGHEIHNREQEALYQSQRDPLTGLYNRTAFIYTVEIATTQERPFLLVTTNIRGFVQINSSLGPELGDRSLCAVATRLQEFPGLHARAGADEFISLLHIPTGTNGENICREFLAAIHQPISVADLSLNIVFRAGACQFPADGDNSKTLLRRSTIALEHTRNEGALISFYRSGDEENMLERLAIVEALKLALQKDDGQLSMYYQPKLNMHKGYVDKVESLIRWQRPGHGWVSPELFIGLAEQSGLIIELTHWVLRTVCRQIHLWQQEGIYIHAAINISAQDINHVEFLPTLNAALAEYQLKPSCITLELTERDLMSDEVQAISLLTELKKTGFCISVDDYGIGQSSLGKLKNLPVDELKIDKSFILKLDTSPTDQIIVRSTITLGHNLGVSVVAEGVENEASWELLHKMGIDYLQGYFISRPFAASELKPWLARFHGVSKHA
ncbi:MAG TPA: EAL domain-containing protein [Cellvibrionaceae bacterium]